MTQDRVSFTAELERKHPDLPVYVVVPYPVAQALRLQATTVVEGSVNGQAIGRRSIKRWDRSERSPWFVEFTSPFCRLARIAVGDRLALVLWQASSDLPPELAQALAQSPQLRAAWDSLPAHARRVAAEHVHAAKAAATRERRAAALVARLAAAAPSSP